MLKASPGISDAELEDALKGIDSLKEDDPLAVLQPNDLPVGEEGAQMTMMKLAPNFEMSMYVAQATGSCIVTDNSFRWQELSMAVYRPLRKTEIALPELARRINEFYIWVCPRRRRYRVFSCQSRVPQLSEINRRRLLIPFETR